MLSLLCIAVHYVFQFSGHCIWRFPLRGMTAEIVVSLAAPGAQRMVKIEKQIARHAALALSNQ